MDALVNQFVNVPYIEAVFAEKGPLGLGFKQIGDDEHVPIHIFTITKDSQAARIGTIHRGMVLTSMEMAGQHENVLGMAYHEVLDRLALLKVGLSAAQKNDWAWFKDAWDQHMVSLHGEQWATIFAD